MKKTFLIISLLAVANPSFGSEATALHEALDKAAGYQASFTQTLSIEGLEDARTEKGTVLFGSLPQMRWDYSSPRKKVFVFDGETSWFYLPSEKQVLIHKVSKDERSQLPFLFLEDSDWINKYYTVSSSRIKNETTVTLKARREGLIRTITAKLDRRTNLIRSLTWTDRDGNRTHFEFDGYEKTKPKSARFRFDPPAGTDIVRN